MKETLPAKIFSIEELIELDKNSGINLENKWKFIIGNKIAYSGYYGIYKDEQSNNYIVYYNKYDGNTERLYIGKSEKKAVDVIWNLFLEELYKSSDNLKMKIPKQFLNKKSKIRENLKIIIIGIGIIVSFIILIKLKGFHNLIEYWIDIK